MTDNSHRTLERIARRVPVPEPAYERLLRRRDRKERNRRISAAVLAIVLDAPEHHSPDACLRQLRAPGHSSRPRRRWTRASSRGWVDGSPTATCGNWITGSGRWIRNDRDAASN